MTNGELVAQALLDAASVDELAWHHYHHDILLKTVLALRKACGPHLKKTPAIVACLAFFEADEKKDAGPYSWAMAYEYGHRLAEVMWPSILEAKEWAMKPNNPAPFQGFLYAFEALTRATMRVVMVGKAQDGEIAAPPVN